MERILFDCFAGYECLVRSLGGMDLRVCRGCCSGLERELCTCGRCTAAASRIVALGLAVPPLRRASSAAAVAARVAALPQRASPHSARRRSAAARIERRFVAGSAQQAAAGARARFISANARCNAGERKLLLALIDEEGDGHCFYCAVAVAAHGFPCAPPRHTAARLARADVCRSRTGARARRACRGARGRRVRANP